MITQPLDIRRHDDRDRPKYPSTAHLAAGISTAVLLGSIQLFIEEPTLLLFERFFKGGGWIEIVGLSGYASFVARKLLNPKTQKIWRSRIWLLFSGVFFAQLLIGLTLNSRFLMTGALHLPVPALIIAGPIYRGEGFFMLFLYLSTLLLAGPAWCSYLCYIGSFDDRAAKRKKSPKPLPAYTEGVRLLIVISVISAAFMLHIQQAAGYIAAYTASAFGIGGLAIMFFGSRKTGCMIHCTVYCPIGWFSNLIGRLSPFRVRIKSGCNDCKACIQVCRYNALTEADLLRRKPGLRCTLCGDCVGRCRTRQMEYSFWFLNADRSRTVFLVLLSVLHCVFLGVARL